VAPTPKSRRKITPTFGQKVKKTITNLGKKETYVNAGKKIATGALIATLSGAPSAYVGYRAYKAAKPFEINSNINRASGNHLTDIPSLRERVTELNDQAEREHVQQISKNNDRETPRKLYYYDEAKGKIVVIETTASKALDFQKKQDANFSRQEKAIEKRVNQLNSTAKPSEIYFWNGEKIDILNLDVVKLSNLHKKLYEDEKKELNDIFSDLAKDLRNNDEFSTKVVKKMKVLSEQSRLDYLASLSVEQLIQEIGSNKKVINRLSRIIKSMEKNNPSVLNFIKKETQLYSGIAAGGAAIASEIALLLLWAKIRAFSNRKKRPARRK